MKRICNIGLLVALSWALASCVGVHVEYEDDTGLVLSASGSSVDIDAGESLSFNVLYCGNDVSENARILYDIAGQTASPTEVGVRPFVPAVAGDYGFYALYGQDTSNVVHVRVYGGEATGSTFYRRANVMLFTGTWCVYCPQMSAAIKTAMNTYPDRMVVMALHASDEYTTSGTTALNNFFNVQGYPAVVMDCVPSSLFLTSSSSLVVSTAQEMIAARPAVCGIAIDAQLVQETVKVGVRVKFAATDAYKVVVALVEDGISGSQKGVSGTYIHDNVVRAFLTNPLGDDLGTRQAQEEYTHTFTHAFNNALWDKAHCRVVVYVMDKQTSSRYYSNNIQTCAIGSTVAYQYEAENP